MKEIFNEAGEPGRITSGVARLLFFVNLGVNIYTMYIRAVSAMIRAWAKGERRAGLCSVHSAGTFIRSSRKLAH